VAGGEQLPFADQHFAAALSQLVLSFVRDADRVMAELSRVVRPVGTLAACTWSGEGLAVTRTLWEAALRVDPAAPDDAVFPFRRMEELEGLFTRAGLDEVATEVIEVEERYDGFDDYWTPLTFGIGPTAWLAAQPPAKQAAIRDACFEVLGRPAGSFTLPARALAVRGRVADA
jgi:SAM-dependent methyltransferase